MSNTPSVTLCWFRRSLRVEDNRALAEAVKNAEQVIPVFVLDPAILSHPSTGPTRTQFLFESLASLNDELKARGSRLIIRYGKPTEELLRLARECGATSLYFGRDYEPYSRERDKKVTDELSAQGIAVHTTSDHLLTEPGDVMSQAGTPYTVFTPYKRVWWQVGQEAPQHAPKTIKTPHDLHSEPLPSIAQIPVGGGNFAQSPCVHGGEAEAIRLLEAFVASKVETYDKGREMPAAEGTSRLSAFLRMGVVSPRVVMAKVQAAKQRAISERRDILGLDTFVNELAWRDFYYQILWHFPHVAGGAFRKEYDALTWDNDEKLFAAWCEGRTGYPFVDAAQRQMNTEAWMHNRARMVTASFLTKDLLCDWRLGERYFMQKLIDGDLAPNNGGWQWAASTGTDAQPFFRIFNPVTQGEKFDPNGDYVRKYVPELARVPNKFIHQPWKLSEAEQKAIGCVLGRDYPLPVVDHKVQREKALALYRRAGADE